MRVIKNLESDGLIDSQLACSLIDACIFGNVPSNESDMRGR
jgi:hypothetical protein